MSLCLFVLHFVNFHFFFFLLLFSFGFLFLFFLNTRVLRWDIYFHYIYYRELGEDCFNIRFFLWLF